jgi:glutamate N-acetyltransferase / amino-acid N-acetyltransferase
VASTKLTFESRAAHRSWLAAQSALPRGFRVGASRFDFVPFEVSKPATMTVTLIALERPSPDFAAMFTKNAFPGAPVKIGRQRLDAEGLGAILVNNKISNVCAPGGIDAGERLCREAAGLLGMPETAVLPSSTGVIGWRLPVDAMVAALPQVVGNLAAGSVLPAAEGIVTTDLYPRSAGRIWARGASLGSPRGPA